MPLRALSYRLHRLVRQLHEDFDPDAQHYPSTKAALDALDAALQDEMPQAPSGKKRLLGAPRDVSVVISRKLRLMRARLAYARRKQSELRDQLDKVRNAKCGSTIRPEWLVKVCLSRPLTSARGYAQAFADLCPNRDASGCSRTTITSIKDAWVEVVKDMNSKEVSVAASVLAAKGHVPGSSQVSTCHDRAEAEGPVRIVVMLHQQDEASMRLRSFKDAGGSSRSRSSKVQQHAVWLLVGSATVPVVTEVEALADKRAVTLTTSLDGVLRQAVASVVEGIGPAPVTRWWYVHMLVGDGIVTNNAAAKLLLGLVRASPPGVQHVRYFLFVVVCATHKANLSTKYAVVGPAAVLGMLNKADVAASSDVSCARAQACDKTAVHNIVCGAVTRLFKYLILDYYDEFLLALRSWVSRSLAIVRKDSRRTESVRVAEDLAALYTERVLPGALLTVWNNGLGTMQYLLSLDDEQLYATDPEGFRASIVGKIVEVLRVRCLVVDESPTLSRFHTFSQHINTLLLMDFLRMGPEVIKLTTVKPQEQNKGRVHYVHKFMKSKDAPQYLRRTSLCLQITMSATGTTSQKGMRGDAPLLVRLCRGEVVERCQGHFTRLLVQLWRDPGLDVGACVSAMMLTTCDLLLRFAEYQGYPCKLCLLCRRWNPKYLVACMQFVAEDEDNLDLGFSAELRKLMKALGGETLQIRFLARDDVQEALENVFTGGSGSTMDVERKHVETKQNESSRLSHIAVASRNQILRWFHRRSRQVGADMRRATKDLQRAMKTNVWSLAWQRCGEFRPQPLGCVAALRGSDAKPQTMVKTGNAAAVRQYVKDHCGDLTAAVQGRQEQAKARMELVRGLVGGSEGECLDWMRENEASFRSKMQTATQDRRWRSRRLQGREDFPLPAKRVQPLQARWLPPAGWAKCLTGRYGWHGVRTPTEMLVIFVAHHRGVAHVVDLAPFRTRPGEYTLTTDLDFCRLLQPLQTFYAVLEVADARAYEFVVTARAVKDAVVVSMGAGAEVKELPRATRKKSHGVDGEDEAEESGSPSDESIGFPASASDTVPSVDTDVDSLVSSPAASEAQTEDNCSASGDGGCAASDDGGGAAGAEPHAAMAYPRGLRNPAGTWKVWENPWFVITDNPGSSQVEVRMKTRWAVSDHMGTFARSRSVTPSQFGDSRDQPARAILILRAWAIWRPGVNGWVMASPGRQRQLDSDIRELEEQIRSLAGPPPSRPLLGSEIAHGLLVQWVPNMVARVLS
jgi:hypothetical protein